MSSLMDATAEELDDLLQGKSFGNLLILADAGRTQQENLRYGASEVTDGASDAR